MTNTIATGTDFGDVIKALKVDPTKSAYRVNWNGKGLRIKIQNPDAGSKMTLPYLYIEYPVPSDERGNIAYPEGSRCPWLASQTDMLTEDWFIE